jgi:hypothetical protein
MFFSFLCRHDPTFLGHSVPYSHSDAEVYIPRFRMHVNTVLFSWYNTELSYWPVGVNIHFLYVYVARSWRMEEDGMGRACSTNGGEEECI